MVELVTISADSGGLGFETPEESRFLSIFSAYDSAAENARGCEQAKSEKPACRGSAEPDSAIKIIKGIWYETEIKREREIG